MAPGMLVAMRLALWRSVFSGSGLWELLAGERLYAGESELELFRDVIGHRIRDLGMFREDVPDALKQVVERTIAKEPSARFDSWRSLVRFISPVLAGYRGGGSAGALFEAPKRLRGTAVLAAGTLVLEERAPSDSSPTASQESSPWWASDANFEEEPYKGSAHRRHRGQGPVSLKTRVG